jgi:uroporphyrinogen decarboxylase
MTSRERIATILQGGVPDRIGRFDTIWPETDALWRTQGLGADESIAARFGYDISGVSGFDSSFRFETEVTEETDEYVIQWDSNGVLRKDFKGKSGYTPHWYDHRINSRETWFANKERLAPSPDRLSQTIREDGAAARATDKFVCLFHTEPYEMAWPVFGQTGIFTLMMDDPELIRDVFETYASLFIASVEMILAEGGYFDGCFIYGDVGYRNATLFSPAIYRELLFPQHQRICRFLRDHGKPAILHSCGKIDVLIPQFIEAGFAAIQPLEAKTGMDVRQLKAEHGNRITFFGNIDIRKLSGTRQDIEEEIAGKLPIAKQNGGYMYHSDHSVPPTVSWDSYCYAMELVEKHGKY